MEENEKIDPEYQRGFNEGYLLAEHLPEVAKQIKSVENNSERTIGLKEGIEQLEIEKEIDKIPLPNWLRENKDRNIDREPDKEIDKDEIEKER